MSAFICTPKHYNSAYEGLVNTFLFNQSYHTPHGLSEDFEELYYAIMQNNTKVIREELGKIFYLLKEMNITTCLHKYSDGDETEEELRNIDVTCCLGSNPSTRLPFCICSCNFRSSRKKLIFAGLT